MAVGVPGSKESRAGGGGRGAGVAECRAPYRVREPEGGMAKLFELPGSLVRLHGGLCVERVGPNADTAECH